MNLLQYLCWPVKMTSGLSLSLSLSLSHVNVCNHLAIKLYSNMLNGKTNILYVEYFLKEPLANLGFRSLYRVFMIRSLKLL
jgi:hypothetical protein